MNKEDIIDYVMHTPQNTNYSVLNSILDQCIEESSEKPELDTITLRVTVPSTSNIAYVNHVIKEVDGGRRIQFKNVSCSRGKTTDCVVPCSRDNTADRKVTSGTVLFFCLSTTSTPYNIAIQSEWLKEKYTQGTDYIVASIKMGAPDIVEVTAVVTAAVTT